MTLSVFQQGDICNDADDNTKWLPNSNIHELKQVLESEVTVLVKWFRDNLMVLNGDKCKLITFLQSQTAEIKSMKALSKRVQANLV